MLHIHVPDDLWASSMLPEGMVKRWLVVDGSHVKAGSPLAEIRIEDAVHEIIAPAAGRLTISSFCGDIVEPGSLIGRISTEGDK